ncbi:MAG: chorismate lyase [Acidiferrobacterales bacterium]|jgi:chorismate--pyruvate lyase|nr:chorismate lyase [Acidiferrobacterales bacterium]
MKPVSTHVSMSGYHPEPVWIPRRRLRQGQVPETILHWLLDRASLTQRIVAACSGQFRVKVLAQDWTRPMSNEAQALGMDSSGHALVRQVQLLCDEEPWVYARTVIPRATLSGRERRLAYLKSKSLGATLFADPSMRRSEVEVVRVTGRDKLYGIVAAQLERTPAVIWGRRSVFTLHDKPLLVSELFLPVIEDKGF